MTSRPLFWIALLVCLWLLGDQFLSPSSSPKRASEAWIDFLASDAHIVVGETPLVLPFVALADYVGGDQSFSFSLDRAKDHQVAKGGLEAFRKVATDPKTAPTISRLKVVVHAFGWNDFDTSMRRICARLSREWSRSVCDNPWAALRQALPENRFYLVDLQTLETSAERNARNCEHPVDRNRPLNLLPGQASLLCEALVYGSDQTSYYTAAIKIDGGLGAIWTVWENSRNRGKAIEMAEREGKAIVALVRDGLGPTENFALLHETVCSLRRSLSRDAPGGSDCRKSYPK